MSAAIQQQTLAGVNFGFVIRPTLRLYEVEEIMEMTQVLGKQKLSRHTLIAMIESGELDGRLTRVGWVVFVDSLKRWMEQFSEQIAA